MGDCSGLCGFCGKWRKGHGVVFRAEDNVTRRSGECVQLSVQCSLADSDLSQLINNHADNS